MSGVFDKAPIEFECPECGSRVSLTIGRARRSPTVRCERGHEIKIDGTQFDRELRGTDRAFDRLERTLRSFGR